MSALLSPTFSPPLTPPSHLPLILRQGKHHVRVTPFSVAAGRWSNVYLAKNALTFFFLFYFYYSRGGGGGKGVRRGERSALMGYAKLYPCSIELLAKIEK